MAMSAGSHLESASNSLSSPDIGCEVRRASALLGYARELLVLRCFEQAQHVLEEVRRAGDVTPQELLNCRVYQADYLRRTGESLRALEALQSIGFQGAYPEVEFRRMQALIQAKVTLRTQGELEYPVGEELSDRQILVGYAATKTLPADLQAYAIEGLIEAYLMHGCTNSQYEEASRQLLTLSEAVVDTTLSRRTLASYHRLQGEWLVKQRVLGEALRCFEGALVQAPNDRHAVPAIVSILEIEVKHPRSLPPATTRGFLRKLEQIFFQADYCDLGSLSGRARQVYDELSLV